MVKRFRMAVALLLLGIGVAASLPTPHAAADIGPCGACAFVQVSPAGAAPGNASAATPSYTIAQ